MTRTLGSVRGAAGNGGPYRDLLGWRDDLGVDHFLFRPFWSGMPVETALESMDLLSREVVPALRQR